MKELDMALNSVFPNAKINYITPFSAIKGVGQEGVTYLVDSVKTSNVGWKVHQPPSMRGKLVNPQHIHLQKQHR